MTAAGWVGAPGQADAGLQVQAEITRGQFRLQVGFTAMPGEVLAVVGPNGAGKSTMLRALAGLTPLVAGRITLAGRTLDDVTTGEFVPAAARPVGFVFQDYRLFPHLTVADNIAFPVRCRGADRSQARSVAVGWMRRLDLVPLASRHPRELSGGQSQRVALARALAGEPSLLLLDEPLAALDARTRLEVQGELRAHLSAFAGPTLLVTHDPLDALVLADRLLVIEGGHVVQEGTPAQVAARPATDSVATLVGLNLYRGRADGDRVVLAEGGGFTVPDHGVHGDVLVAVRPSAVTVSLAHPEGTSARNTWAATVTGLTPLADRVRLSLAGRPTALVDVTAPAVAELGLQPGAEVWLSVKATDLDVYPASAPRVPAPSEP